MKVKFWIKSNRGTNNNEIINIPDEDINLLIDDYYTIEDMLKDELEAWCSDFGAWNHSDNIIKYGFEVMEKCK